MTSTPIIGPLAEGMANVIVGMGFVALCLVSLGLLFVHWLKHRHDFDPKNRDENDRW